MSTAEWYTATHDKNPFLKGTLNQRFLGLEAAKRADAVTVIVNAGPVHQRHEIGASMNVPGRCSRKPARALVSAYGQFSCGCEYSR